MMQSEYSQPKRQSMRITGYDYALAGGYFVTLCTQRREPFFGQLLSDEVALNASGQMVKEYWLSLGERFPTLILDEMILMPEHLHAILLLQDCFEVGGLGRKNPSLGDIIGAFKSLTTLAYIQGVKIQGWKPFDGKLWQRNYYDHIIRDEGDLNQIRHYIRYNAVKRSGWEL